jgi:hypothetical protein
MRFRFGRRRRHKPVDAAVGAAPAGAATDPDVVPEAAQAPAETALEPSPAESWKQPENDPQTPGELSVEKLDQALKRLQTEIPVTEDDASR